MHWILQENLFKETEWENLVGCLERFNIPYSVHKVIPFIGELVPTAEPKDPKVVCFGSYSMRHAAKANAWTPGVYDLQDMDFIQQRKYWGSRMLNFWSIVCKFKDAKELTEPMFIRPVDDSKYFAGKVFMPEEFNEWKHKVVDLGEDYGNSLTGDTLVQFCQPLEIYAEYRCWVVNGEIVTSSLYKRGDRVIYSSDVPPAAIDLAYSCLRDWEPHHAFVLDVCDTPHGWRVVEINTINAAGFYAGDVQKLVMALEQLESP